MEFGGERFSSRPHTQFNSKNWLTGATKFAGPQWPSALDSPSPESIRHQIVFVVLRAADGAPLAFGGASAFTVLRGVRVQEAGWF
jgi:hypothetical protein